MDKPKPRGTNKPKNFSPNRQEKRMTETIGPKRIAEQTQHTAGAKPEQAGPASR